jgi:hypothetical protein
VQPLLATVACSHQGWDCVLVAVLCCHADLPQHAPMHTTNSMSVSTVARVCVVQYYVCWICLHHFALVGATSVCVWERLQHTK